MGEACYPAAPRQELAGLGKAVAFGIEGTGSGSYGAGLARYLAGRGDTVNGVNRPDRSVRRRKSGEERPWSIPKVAAQALLPRVYRDYPRSGLEKVEMIQMLKIVEARTSGHDRTDAASLVKQEGQKGVLLVRPF